MILYIKKRSWVLELKPSIFTYYNMIELKLNPLSKLSFEKNHYYFVYYYKRCERCFAKVTPTKGDQPVCIYEPRRNFKEALQFEM